MDIHSLGQVHRDLRRLKKDMHHTQRSAFAMGTWSNLHTQIKAFLLFCVHFRLVAIPASLETVRMYAQFLSRSFKSPQSIKNYLHAIKFLHIVHDYEYPYTESYLLKMLMNGIERIVCHVPKRAVPITPSILLHLANIVNWTHHMDIVCFSAGLFLFFTMARAGNVFSHFAQGVHMGLRRRDVVAIGDTIFITFKRTKTIRFGGRRLRVPLAPNGTHICPVSALTHMISQVPAHSKDGLFVLPCQRNVMPLTQETFLRHFRRMLAKAAIPDPDTFTCHSFRRGGASWAFRAGLPGELIQLFGDWSSDCYKLYLDVSNEHKWAFANRKPPLYNN